MSDASECDSNPCLSVKRLGRKEILISEISAALNRTKKIDKTTMHIFAITEQILRLNHSEVNQNCSSNRRKSNQHRSSKFLEILPILNQIFLNCSLAQETDEECNSTNLYELALSSYLK